MKIDYQLIDGVSIGIVYAEGNGIKLPQNAIDVMADCLFSGTDRVIFFEKDLPADFFDLKSGFAGEVLQKFSTYRVRLAIVGDFSKYASKNLRSFIFESNRYGHINFVDTLDEARERLKKRHT